MPQHNLRCRDVITLTNILIRFFSTTTILFAPKGNESPAKEASDERPKDIPAQFREVASELDREIEYWESRYWVPTQSLSKTSEPLRLFRETYQYCKRMSQRITQATYTAEELRGLGYGGDSTWDNLVYDQGDEISDEMANGLSHHQQHLLPIAVSCLWSVQGVL